MRTVAIVVMACVSIAVVNVVCAVAGAKSGLRDLVLFGGEELLVLEPGALVCSLPSSIKEAVAAGTDQKWLASIGCGYVEANTPATFIEKPVGMRGYSMVRIKPPGLEPRTVYGFDLSFKLAKPRPE